MQGATEGHGAGLGGRAPCGGSGEGRTPRQVSLSVVGGWVECHPSIYALSLPPLLPSLPLLPPPPPPSVSPSLPLSGQCHSSIYALSLPLPFTLSFALFTLPPSISPSLPCSLSLLPSIPLSRHRQSDLALCLGTTLQILPAGKLPLLAKKNKGHVVVCNLQPTKYVSILTCVSCVL